MILFFLSVLRNNLNVNPHFRLTIFATFVDVNSYLSLSHLDTESLSTSYPNFFYIYLFYVLFFR